jgi:succinyl-diaminopimelate desuccinylase
MSMSRRQFNELRTSLPAVEDFLFQAMAARLRRTDAHLMEALFVPAEKRALRRLISVALLYAPTVSINTKVPVTQAVLAGMAGTTRPTANQILRAAEEDGIIALGRKTIVILRPIELRKRAGLEPNRPLQKQRSVVNLPIRHEQGGMMNALDEITLTARLIGIDTRNPPGDERDAADVVGQLLADAGFKVRYHEFAPRRTSVIAQIGDIASRDPLCLTGHLDTVPLGSAHWTRDPFAAEIDGDRLYGRGAADMKGGVAAILTAAVRLSERLSDTMGLTLVLTASEEGGCLGSEDLIHRDGLLIKPGAMIVAEPTSNYPCVGHRGAMKFTATFKGRAAHGSMPGVGVNAIYAASRTVTELEGYDFSFEGDPMMGIPTLNVGTFHGGDAINSIPDEAVIGVDVRTVPGLEHSRILTDIRDLIGRDTRVNLIQDMPPVWTDPRSEWVGRIMGIWSDLVGEPAHTRTLPYNTDSGNFRKLWPEVPIIILGPGEPEMAHQTDEFCSISQISQAAKIYELLITDWCGL